MSSAFGPQGELMPGWEWTELGPQGEVLYVEPEDEEDELEDDEDESEEDEED
jgi:hypothetical protein